MSFKLPCVPVNGLDALMKPDGALTGVGIQLLRREYVNDPVRELRERFAIVGKLSLRLNDHEPDLDLVSARQIISNFHRIGEQVTVYDHRVGVDTEITGSAR